MAASTHWIILLGANCPFLIFAANARASTITFSSPLTSFNLEFKSLTLGRGSFFLLCKNFIDSSITSASVILSIIPTSSAFFAGTCFPVNIIFKASEGPIILGSR